MSARIALLVALGTAACTGTIGVGLEDEAPAPDPQPPAATGSAGAGTTAAGAAPPRCGQPSRPGPSPLRRLTRYEYDNTIRDLLGDDSHPASIFPPDEKIGGFDNNADASSVTTLLADQYLVASERLAARAAGNLSAVLRCDPGTSGEDACARAFIESFGRRAWRRPLTDPEKGRLFGLYASDRAGMPFPERIALVIQALLQSPKFLYRVEVGSPTLGPYEIASRLSYLLWSSMPDDELLRAADAGRLTTRGEIASQARRLLADGRARPVAARFHEQWLDLDRIDETEKDRKIFPAFDAGLRSSFRAEVDRFLDHVLWDGEGDLRTLLTAPFSFMNARLASFYGVTGPRGAALEKVTLPVRQRAGFLTQAGLLSALAKANQTSPVERGLFVRQQLLCTTPPPPPPGLEVKPPDLDPRLTTRERFTEHMRNPACFGCHRLMDPVGLGFESYDGMGAFRETENGKPVDVSGELLDADAGGPFVGALELARKLAASQQVRDCVRTQWFRHAAGRGETMEDACTLTQLSADFAASDGNVRGLLLALTQTDAFLLRSTGDGDPR